MRYTWLAGICAGALVLWGLTLAVESGAAAEEYVTHTVTRGETVSLLCIELYGYYSTELGAAVQKENPAIKDLNLIEVGQKIRFVKPLQESAGAQKAPQKPARKALFTRRTGARQGVVTWVEGEAECRRAKGASEPLLVNQMVYPGDTILTGEGGRVEIIINREAVVRVRRNSRLIVEALRDPGKTASSSSCSFSLGSVWSKVKKFSDTVTRFKLELPTAIAGVHGTVYQSTVNADSSAEVKVFEGEVAVKNRAEKKSPAAGLSEVPGPVEVPGPHEVSFDEWVRIIRSMQKVSISRDGKASEPETFESDPNDSWEQWNKTRDRRIAEMFQEI